MLIREGIAVSSGIAIGEALVVGDEGLRIPRHFVAREAVAGEVQRLHEALAAAADSIARDRDSVSQQLGLQIGAIFAAHLQMLEDERLRTDLERLVRENLYSAEYAVSETLRGYARVLDESDNPYLAERTHDIHDLERKLLRNLLGGGHSELSQLNSQVIVLAHDLTPSETANLKKEFVLGFVTERGGASGHTAIVAKGMELPAVVGLGPFLDEVSDGDLVIIDGDQGRVIVRPDEATLDIYRRQDKDRRSRALRLLGLRDLPAVTLDGTRIYLLANIEFPAEIPACLERGADGIGLYRTEFLYLSQASEPSEEDHYQAYAEVVRAMGGRPVVIRTLDLGADKMGLVPLDADAERNPFLGMRSIRLSLSNPQLFKPQLRAVLRASPLGDVRVMFPLISTLGELRRAKQMLHEAMGELETLGLPFQREIPVGMMVESPAAATLIDLFVREVDFISIGTNDLIQYTLAVDRTNPHVADLYDAGDPAVLRLIARSVRTATAGGREACLCGQMGSEAMYVMVLLGLGLRELSVAPSAIPELKRICRSLTIEACEAVARRALELDTAAEVDACLRQELERLTLQPVQ